MWQGRATATVDNEQGQSKRDQIETVAFAQRVGEAPGARPWRGSDVQGESTACEHRNPRSAEMRERVAQLAKYQICAQQGGDIILFVRRRDWQILEANAAASKAYGYTKEEFTSLSASDILGT